ncbi:lysine 6-monooxygenase [Pseudohoeflea suaedae]|uniref:Lysine 6-monooxygenase n=1 Tax=Pseudohoeflea suaedae TaxID=877384 RepID=A0A4R5PNM4_9HYPH|nr:SidA/IucD/PvdA family monooxygenase [Pseudohoeflea suaedae]TDH38433.1 lysine 6-monooxygenase [Pseudohoeflea suaedae]
MTHEQQVFDLAGIGLGPFNLSLAALADGIETVSAAFFERQQTFAWHPGLCFSDAILQTSPLKDLVTPVRPTSRWSFLNYLVEKGLFFDFMAARFETASRQEFSAYLAWAAEGIGSAHLGADVEEVTFDGDRFRLRFGDRPDATSRALAIGTGRAPVIPDGISTDNACFHAGNYLKMRPETGGKRVAVIGGGQSGAEILLHLMQQEGAQRPAAINWISRRDGFWTLQEGGLVDQFFTPNYLNAYRTLGPEAQSRALASQKFASDGLTSATADEIYRLLYRRQHLEGRRDVDLHPGRTVVKKLRNGASQSIVMRNIEGDEEMLDADIIVLATGYGPAAPACLNGLADRLNFEPDGALALGENYRVRWNGPDNNPIYGLNHGSRSYGVIDPQLSMAAWRSAVILNDLVGRTVFEGIEGSDRSLIKWTPDFKQAARYSPAA